jgi:hypothetical protein
MLTVLLLLTVAMGGILANGCAVLKIRVWEKPFQGDLRAGVNDLSDHRIIRPYQAVRETRYFWGTYSYVVTCPVDYNYYERNHCKLADFFLTELQKNTFYVVQPPTGTTTLDVLEKAGVIKKVTGTDKDGRSIQKWETVKGAQIGEEEKQYFMPLESTMSPYIIPFVRVLTLGLFWDTGYAVDDKVWGRSNKVYNRAWFGQAEFIVVKDVNGNFHTLRIWFDPSRTVHLAGRLAAKAGKIYLKANAAATLMAVTPPVENPNDSTYPEQLRRYGYLKAKQDRVDQLTQSLRNGPLDRQTGEKALEDLCAKNKTVLSAVLRSYDKVKEPITAGKDDLAKAAAVTLEAAEVQSGAFEPCKTFP